MIMSLPIVLYPTNDVFFFLAEILLPTLIETGSAAAACLGKFCCKINVVKLMSILS